MMVGYLGSGSNEIIPSISSNTHAWSLASHEIIRFQFSLIKATYEDFVNSSTLTFLQLKLRKKTVTEKTTSKYPLNLISSKANEVAGVDIRVWKISTRRHTLIMHASLS